MCSGSGSSDMAYVRKVRGVAAQRSKSIALRMRASIATSASARKSGEIMPAKSWLLGAAVDASNLAAANSAARPTSWSVAVLTTTRPRKRSRQFTARYSVSSCRPNHVTTSQSQLTSFMRCAFVTWCCRSMKNGAGRVRTELRSMVA